MITTRTQYIFCPKINEEAAMVFNSIEDKKKGLKTDPVMENCGSARKCGVEDKSGGINMNKYPFNKKNCPNFELNEVE